jgi:transposase
VVARVRLVLDGKITREVRTFETTTSGLLLLLLAWLTELGCTYVAMEATGVYWKLVWNILSDGDFELVLANAAHRPARRPAETGETAAARTGACCICQDRESRTLQYF